MAGRTLEAAEASVSGGQLDVWLLDEGDDTEVKEMCRASGCAALHQARERGS